MPRTIDDLIEILRKVDDSPTSKCGFDMHYDQEMTTFTEHPCGSACCIGGHAALALHRYLYPDQALVAFGISTEAAKTIAYPPQGHKAWDAAPAHAIRLLEIYRDEGKVDWDRAMEEVK